MQRQIIVVIAFVLGDDFLLPDKLEWGCMQNQNNRGFPPGGRRASRQAGPAINENIPYALREFTLIDENGTNLGRKSRDEALRLGRERDLDVVLITPPDVLPAVVKIMDYGREQYEQKRKRRESKKKQTTVKTKEVGVRLTIAEHDLLTRSKKAIMWLDDGNHVKFVVKAYGRMGHGVRQPLIYELFDRFRAMVGEHGEVEKPFTQTSPVMYEAILVPPKNKKPKVHKKPEASQQESHNAENEN